MRIVYTVRPIALEDATDVTRLSARIDTGDHVWVRPDVIERLAGDAASDPEWQTGFAAMLQFAAEHGWTDAAGALRAHLEVVVES